jgi:hypothetical protein
LTGGHKSCHGGLAGELAEQGKTKIFTNGKDDVMPAKGIKVTINEIEIENQFFALHDQASEPDDELGELMDELQ